MTTNAYVHGVLLLHCMLRIHDKTAQQPATAAHVQGVCTHTVFLPLFAQCISYSVRGTRTRQALLFRYLDISMSDRWGLGMKVRNSGTRGQEHVIHRPFTQVPQGGSAMRDDVKQVTP
jgi:hypothetical protein